LEFLQRLGIPVPLYATLNGLVHSGSDQLVNAWDGAINRKLLEGWDQRLRSVSFEPPAFGNFSGFAWPWLLAGVLAAGGATRVRGALLLGAFTVLILLSQARTGQLLIMSNLVVFVALRYVFAPPNGRYRPLLVGTMTIFGAIALIVGLAVAAASVDEFTETVVAGDSISNLSRLAFQTSAFAMFAAHPITGVGFGQFAFNSVEFMPAWAYFSSEVSESLTHPGAAWPNTYSLYARICAETGALGLLGWLALWLSAIAFLVRDTTAYARRFGRLPFVTYPLVMNCMAVLVAGITTDTFRTPMMWIALGGTAALLATVRKRLAQSEGPLGGSE
jgi:O-antigen ligase